MVEGNYVIGLIVFLILVVVQYVVVTNGAQRVAEVAARFTLDSMPGQQMSIDADLNMGLIDQAEAKRRRKNLEKEANFYGAMDGASKFVKGDAIAGIVIVLINIIGGLAIGVTQHGMPWAEALQTYTLLTIGDGIVTQIPALVISVGTGIIITRSASDARLSAEIVKQTTAYPRTLLLVMVALLALMALPGIPLLPVLLIAAVVGALSWFALRSQREQSEQEAGAKTEKAADEDDVYAQPERRTAGAAGRAEPDQAGQRKRRAADGPHRRVPQAVRARRRLRDAEGAHPRRPYARAERVPDLHLRRHGGVTASCCPIARSRSIAAATRARACAESSPQDPAYGLPAVWITDDERQNARDGGYTLIDPTTVAITHLSEVVRSNAAALLTRAETEQLLNRLRPQQASLLDELVPQVLSLGEIQKVLQNLLQEKVSIRNLEAVLEVLADAGRQNKDPEQLTELVRQRLGTVICQGACKPRRRTQRADPRSVGRAHLGDELPLDRRQDDARARAALCRADAVAHRFAGREDDEGQRDAGAAVRARAAPPPAPADRARDAAPGHRVDGRGADQHQPEGLRRGEPVKIDPIVAADTRAAGTAQLLMFQGDADFSARLTLGQIIKGRVLRSYEGQRYRGRVRRPAQDRRQCGAAGDRRDRPWPRDRPG